MGYVAMDELGIMYGYVVSGPVVAVAVKIERCPIPLSVPKWLFGARIMRAWGFVPVVMVTYRNGTHGRNDNQ